MMSFKRIALAAALTTVAMPIASADAATIVINVTGARSIGEQGAAGNTVASYLLAANAHITGVAYNVNITAFSPSYLSEAIFSFTNNAGDGVNLTPGFQNAASGTASFASSANLVTLGLDFVLGADGRLYTEYFEDFDDASANPDAIWNSGTITITYDAAAGAVPEPATWAMLIAGFGAIGGTMRRRRAQVRVRYA